MPRVKIGEKLFRYMWHRFVAGKSEEEAAEIAGLDPGAFEDHRARRTPQYVQAEQRLADAIPLQMLVVYAKAAQLRALTRGSESTAASVAARVLEHAPETKDQPTAITFVVVPAEEELASIEDLRQHKPQTTRRETAPGEVPDQIIPLGQRSAMRVPMAATKGAHEVATKAICAEAKKVEAGPYIRAKGQQTKTGHDNP